MSDKASANTMQSMSDPNGAWARDEAGRAQAIVDDVLLGAVEAQNSQESTPLPPMPPGLDVRTPSLYNAAGLGHDVGYWLEWGKRAEVGSIEVVVGNPMECPFNSECRCNLYDKIEGDTANRCPGGRYPDYEFPVKCPLIRDDYLIKKGRA